MNLRPARRLGGALLAALGLAAPIPAQEATAPTSVPEATAPTPDVPAGNAVLAGRVVHPERPEGAAGVEVVLYALSRSHQAGLRRSKTGPDGRFRFEGISGEPEVVYLVGASYQEIPFLGERVTFAAGESEREVEISISEPSEDASQVELVQSSVRVEWLGDRIGLSEVHRLRNRGDRVFHVLSARRAGRRAPLHARLPRDATDFTMPFGTLPEGAVRDGDDFRFWGPIYPGEQEISFRYEVPVRAGLNLLEKRFPTAAGRVRVFGREGGLLESASDLAPGPAVEEESIRFQLFERERTPAGFATTLRLQIPESVADVGALALVESQIVLEVDDVLLRAQEQHRIDLPGSAAALAAPGELLMELPLPEDAEEIRFSTDASHLGLVRTEAGVGLVGPIPPGSHGLALAYTLRSSPDGVRLERRFDRRLPLVRVLVADTGVAVETNRLHRRRPVRDADRTYLIFEAFELEGGEVLDLSLRPLPPRVGSDRPALLVAVLAGLGAVALLVAPLRGSGRGASERDEPVEGARRATAGAAREREAVYESIHDLDHDHETGKLDDSDWRVLRDELRAQAVELLARERVELLARERAGDGSAAPAAPTAEATASLEAGAGAACSGCGTPTRAGDRFCSRCGRPLTEEATRA